MKTTLKKSMAMILVVLMALSCCAISSFAAESVEAFTVTAMPDSTQVTDWMRSIETYGNYIYTVGFWAGLEVWDATNPASPVKTSFVDANKATGATPGSFDGTANDSILVHGDYLYVGYNDGAVRKYSLENPASPSLVATFTGKGGQVYDIAVHNNNELLTSTYNGTGGVWDNTQTGEVTNPGNFFHGANISLAQSNAHGYYYSNRTSYFGHRDCGEYGGAVYSFGVNNGYLYTLEADTFKVLPDNTSNISTNMENATSLAIADFDESAVVARPVFYENYVIFTSDEGNLIFDVSDPSNPVRVNVSTPTYTTSNVALGNDGYLYVTNKSSKANLGIVKFGAKGVSLQRQDTVLTVAAQSPTAQGTSWIRTVETYGDYIYTSAHWSGLEVWDATNPAAPTKTSFVDPKKSGSGIGSFDAAVGDNILIEGGYLYIGYNDGVIQKFDLANPANPVLVQTFTGGGGQIMDLVVNGTTLYSTGNAGSGTFDLASEESTVASSGGWPHGANTIGTKSTIGAYYYSNRSSFFGHRDRGEVGSAVYSMGTNNGYLYILENGAFKVISDTEGTGSFAERYANAGVATFDDFTASAVAANPGFYENYVVFTSGDGNLIFDVSDPANPVRVNMTTPTYSLMDAAMGNDGYLYIAQGSAAQQIGITRFQNVISEIDSTEITTLPVTFGGTATGVSSITLTVGSDSYTVPVVGGKWSKEITSISDTGEITVTATADTGIAVSQNYTIPVPELAVNVSYTDTFNANVRIENNNENKEFMVILVVYNGTEIYDVDYEVISANATLSCVTPEGDVSGYTAETFVWSNLMVPFLTVPVAR